MKELSWRWDGTQFVPDESIPVSDRGFRYGMSVFETIRIANGAPLFLREHLVRLEAACAQCGFPFHANAWARGSELLGSLRGGVARLFVTAGDGPVTGDFAGSRALIFAEERGPIPSRIFHRGYDLGISPEPHLPFPGGWKTGNYWANIAALRAGIERQHDESLLFNPRGELISACMANVFVVRGGTVLTPGLGLGARDGVLREWIRGRVPVREEILHREDLSDCDEIFLSSSWLGVMPVAAIETRKLPSREIGTALRQQLIAAQDD